MVVQRKLAEVKEGRLEEKREMKEKVGVLDCFLRQVNDLNEKIDDFIAVSKKYEDLKDISEVVSRIEVESISCEEGEIKELKADLSEVMNECS